MATKLDSLFTELEHTAAIAITFYKLQPENFEVACNGIALKLRELIQRAAANPDERKEIDLFWSVTTRTITKEEHLENTFGLFGILYAVGGGESGYGIDLCAKKVLKKIVAGCQHMLTQKKKLHIESPAAEPAQKRTLSRAELTVVAK